MSSPMTRGAGKSALVAVVVLGGDGIGVGSQEERFQVGGVVGVDRAADGRGQSTDGRWRIVGSIDLDSEGTNGQSYAFGDVGEIRGGGVGQQDSEVLGGQSPEQIVFAHVGPQRLGDPAQNAVADGRAVRAGEPGESVQVNQQHADRGVLGAGPLQRLAGHFVPEAGVVQPGDGIVARGGLELEQQQGLVHHQDHDPERHQEDAKIRRVVGLRDRAELVAHQIPRRLSVAGIAGQGRSRRRPRVSPVAG